MSGIDKAVHPVRKAIRSTVESNKDGTVIWHLKSQVAGGIGKVSIIIWGDNRVQTDVL